MEKSIRFNTISATISSIVGLIAIGLIVWRGGGLAMWVTNVDDKHTVKEIVIEKRVANLEVEGSVKVQRHIDTDERLQTITENRLNKVETAVEEIRRLLGEMNGDSKVIRRGIDDLTTQLNLHMQIK